MRPRCGCGLWASASFLSSGLAQSLPYNPTTILLPSSSSWNKDIAYAFLQSPATTEHYLASINISSTLTTSNILLETLSPNLPFISDDSNAFIPSIAPDGQISVYAGACSTPGSAPLWIFTPTNTSSTGNGSWKREATATASETAPKDLPGAGFLSGGFAFSPLVEADGSQANLYIFGGMCPTTAAKPSTWQSAASYSNHMLRLEPSSTKYELELTRSSGPPIAEAGFTITGLTPTYSNGSGLLTQQQNFVLLAGHTQTAFINTSQVAIWSLPEESWSFVEVEAPSLPSPNTELAVKSIAARVDSRSGHSAVLTEDGSRIIMLGGWVGDTTQAADPQLAVLELGAGYGGSGDWAWSIPPEQPSGTGFYGHGAVMLPGNVMMVLGGYSISGSTESKRDAATGMEPMFLNATSLSWISNYTNPAYLASTEESAGVSSSSADSKWKLGLGIGLGLGILAILIAAGVYIWYRRRGRSRRVQEREKHIQALSAGTCNYFSVNGEMSERLGGVPWASNVWDRSSAHGPTVPGYENLDSGVHGLGDSGIPNAPRQITRKPLQPRNTRLLYQPAPSFDPAASHGRANSLSTAGPIHPIYEADEDDHLSQISDIGVGKAFGDSGSTPANQNRYSDPFRDPQLPTSTLPPQKDRSVETPEPDSPARSREREIQEWVSDWAAADALLASQSRSHSGMGRTSPTRRAHLTVGQNSISSVSGEEENDRAASSLSGHSVAISAMTVSRSGSTSQNRPRNSSVRGFIASAMGPLGLLPSATNNRSPSPALDAKQPPRSAGSGASSFTTAHTSFPALQAEGEGLLPRPAGEVYLCSGDSSPAHSLKRSSPDSPPGSPSKTKTPAISRARVSWLGSLRRVLIGDSTSGDTRDDLNFGTRTPSPTHVGFVADAQPRRTVSAGATLWRRKQGKGDWEDSADLDRGSGRSNTFTSEVGSFAGGASQAGDEGDGDDEWDIERAVENRVVQVMFTVPKERLRVVNQDVPDESSETTSLKSPKGSKKSLRETEPRPLSGDDEAEKVDGGEADVKGKARGRVAEIVEKIERSSDDGV